MARRSERVRGFVMNWLGEKITLDLRTEMYDHLQKLSLSYYDQKETGWIMDRVHRRTAPTSRTS